MLLDINVIFPMAGDGTRFGGKEFKPFIDGTEKLFIELAKEPFNVLKDTYSTSFYFIFRKDQEDKFNVTEKLKKLFPTEKLHFCIIPSETKGPAETLNIACNLYNLAGSFFICDCDHAINIEPMIEYINTKIPDIIVPLWTIKESESASFGKVKISPSSVDFYEKEIIPFSDEYTIKGILGCYFFKEISIFKNYNNATNISDILPGLYKSLNMAFVDIKHAGFFGTPESLISYRFQLAKKMTFFIDIDGTILYLPKHVSYEQSDSKVLDGVIEKLEQWKNEGHSIVLTTGRVHDRREKLIKLLDDLKVPYDQLVTNLKPGPRILINDKKPYSEIHKMATAFQLQRNVGIGNINIDETPTIIKKLKGGSFANTYLIEKEGKEIVRKYIEKTKDLEIHVNTLKRQYDDIKRFSYYSPNLMPKIYNSGENESEFYYDMEYLYGYSELSHYSSDIIKNVTTRVLDVLYSDIYCYSKVIDGKLWMTDFINEKIIPKYKYLESINSSFYTILNSESIIINGKILPGLKKLFSTLNNNDLYPDSVSPIHGDLTLENILYNSELDTFKLIDMSGSRYVDIKEMDYAKLLQSLMAKYEVWINISDLKIVEDNNSFTIDPIYLDVNKDSLKFLFNSEKLYKRSVFILGTYFIRMIPFLHKVSTQHALFGLLLGTYYSSYFSDLNILNK